MSGKLSTRIQFKDVSKLRRLSGCSACFMYSPTLPSADVLIRAWAAETARTTNVSCFHCESSDVKHIGVCLFAPRTKPECYRTPTPSQLASYMTKFRKLCKLSLPPHVRLTSKQTEMVEATHPSGSQSGTDSSVSSSTPHDGGAAVANKSTSADFPKSSGDRMEAIYKKSHSLPQLIWFYARWCGHCHDLLPVWSELASNHSDVAGWHGMDADEHPDVVEQHGVQGFPTIIQVSAGVPTKYSGPRDAGSILNSLQPPNAKTSGGADAPSLAAPIQTLDTHGSGASGSATVVLYHDPRCKNSKNMRAVFMQAKRQSPYDAEWSMVDCTSNVDLCRQRGITQVPTLHVHNGGTQVAYPDDSSRTVDSLLNFLASVLPSPSAGVTAPTSGEVESDASPQRGGDDGPEGLLPVKSALGRDEIVLVLFHAPWCGHCRRFMPVWTKISKHINANIAGVHAHAIDCEADKTSASHQSVRSFPTLRVYAPWKQQDGLSSDEYDGRRDPIAILKFLQELALRRPSPPVDETQAGTVKMNASSSSPAQPARVGGDQTAIRAKVEALEEIEQNLVKGKRVILLFFTNWCGHCKRLAPAWNEAVAYCQRAMPDVGWHAVDCDQFSDLANARGVRGYPTIMSFSRSSPTPSMFSGTRNARSIVDFARKT